MTNERMTPERLAEIEARANAATPGPWKIYGCADLLAIEFRQKDIFFIAHAREDVPDLVAEVRQRDIAIDNLCELLDDSPAFDCDECPAAEICDDLSRQAKATGGAVGECRKAFRLWAFSKDK